MGGTFEMSLTMELMTCGQCGLSFAVPQRRVNEWRDTHETFWCPNGHTRAFNAESGKEKVERLKLESELALQAQLNEARHAQLVAEKERDGAIKDKRKVERRIAHGVCPCCNKTFADLSNHMVTEHKDFRLPSGKVPKQITGRVQ